MDLNRAFYVETMKDGQTKIHNAGKKFFSGCGCKSRGVMERFGAEDASAKNAYISRLKKEGWLPLSLEDINKISVDNRGVITRYPFKYRKGYMALDKIEAAARILNHVWESADHGTNPFSALKDYTVFVNKAEIGVTCDIKLFKRQISDYKNRLAGIGAIETIENFFAEMRYTPDPRRFNKTAKELCQYYRSHLKDCCRIVAQGHFIMSCEDFEYGALLENFHEMEPLWTLISDKAYKEWEETGARKQGRVAE